MPQPNMQLDFLSALGAAPPQPLGMSFGSTGNEVTNMQQQLKQIGFDPGALDGQFGPKTLKAVQGFQKDKGLQVDGLAGPKTRTVLDTIAPIRPGFTKMPEIPTDAFAQAISQPTPVPFSSESIEEMGRRFTKERWEKLGIDPRNMESIEEMGKRLGKEKATRVAAGDTISLQEALGPKAWRSLQALPPSQQRTLPVPGSSLPPVVPPQAGGREVPADNLVASLQGVEPQGSEVAMKTLIEALPSIEERPSASLADTVFENTVKKFETGDRAKRHNNPGAHIWTPELAEKFGAEKGDPFTDASGKTYYTAKYRDPSVGETASKYVTEKIWNRVGGDPEKFAQTYTGLPADSSTVKAYADSIKSVISEPGIKGGQVTLFQEPTSAQPGGVPMEITGLESFPQYGKEKPPSKEEIFAEMLGGAPTQTPEIKKVGVNLPATVEEAKAPGGKGIPAARVKTTMESLDEFFGSPIVQQSLAEFGAALDPEGFAGRLAKGTISQAQGQLFQNYMGRLLAGESPDKIKGLDVAGMTPQMIQSAIREAEAIKSAKTAEARAGEELRIKEEEAASKQGLRSAQVAALERRFISDVLELESGTKQKEALQAYSIIKSIAGTLPPGTTYLEALQGGQKIRTNEQNVLLEGAIRSLKKLGLQTFGLEELIKDVPTISTEEEFNALPSGQEFIYNGKRQVKK